jgi:S1-C subfamily serine protease
VSCEPEAKAAAECAINPSGRDVPISLGKLLYYRWPQEAAGTMTTSTLIPIRCGQCGRLYHVPATSLERRARCVPCGNEFEVPSQNPASSRGARKTTAHQSAPQDRLVALQIAAMTSHRRLQRARSFRTTFAASSVVSLVGLCLFAVVCVWIYHHSANAANLRRGNFVRLAAPRGELAFDSVVDLVEAVEPAVVQIKSNLGMGSGFVIDEAGLVVTCFHCVNGAAESTVAFADGRRERVIGLRGAWPDHDIAIVQISTLSTLVSLPLETEPIKKGEPVVAFGAPDGLSFSISEGSISAKRTGKDLIEILSGRPSNEVRGTNYLDLAPSTSILQITAASMPGSSGGPVVNFSGNVVGICSFGLRRDGQQFGFCISVEDICQVAQSFDNNELTSFE